MVEADNVVELAGMADAAMAQVNSLERLVMPGPLSAAHADLEAGRTTGSVILTA